MTTKVVFFDFFNTLGCWGISIGQTANEVASQFGLKVNWDNFGPALGALYNAPLPEDPTTDPADGIRSRYRGFAEAIFGKCHQAAANAIMRVDHAYFAPENAVLFEETIEVLEELRNQGYRMAVISNWDTSLREVFRLLKIDQYFEVVIESHSQKVMSIKPDSRIFQIACEAMDIDPAQAVHIGDTFDADIEGASNAGIRAIFVDRKGKKPGVWDETISDLRGVLELI